jgi:hypothetical protein
MILFLSKAGIYLFWVSSSLTHKHLTRLERPAGDKHCSLFCPFKSYKERKSNNIFSWTSEVLQVRPFCHQEMSILFSNPFFLLSLKESASLAVNGRKLFLSSLLLSRIRVESRPTLVLVSKAGAYPNDALFM